MADNFQDPETKRPAVGFGVLANNERPYQGMLNWLQTEVWPQLPPEDLGGQPMSKTQIEEILGSGPGGV